MDYFERKQAFMAELIDLLRKYDVMLMPQSFQDSCATLIESTPDANGAVFFVSPQMIHDALDRTE